MLASGEVAGQGRLSIGSLASSTDIAGVARCNSIVNDAKGVLGLLF